jgi:hypothetical protein
VGDWSREEDPDICAGEAVMTLSSLDRPARLLGVVVGAVWLLMDILSMLSRSPLFEAGPFLSLEPVTTPLKRLYNPLKPFCTRSLAIAMLLLSWCVEEGGGDANSLKVVSESE